MMTMYSLIKQQNSSSSFENPLSFIANIQNAIETRTVKDQPQKNKAIRITVSNLDENKARRNKESKVSNIMQHNPNHKASLLGPLA